MLMLRLGLFFQLLVMGCFMVSCQSQSIDGVYGGVKLSLGMMGGGMNRSDIVVYLRKDGTFTDELEKPTWKKDVRGTYIVKGKEVVLTYTKNKEVSTFDINPKGYLLASGQYPLFKMYMDKAVPVGSFKYTGGASSGGGISGMAYAGIFTQSNINFDGKGRFSHSRFNTVSVSGDNMAGGANSSSDDSGQYSYKDGVLELTYGSGKKTVHSCFFMDGKDPFLAMDGRIYVTNKDKDSKAEKTEVVPSSSVLLEKVIKAQGGEALESMRNMKLVAQDGKNSVVVSMRDYERKRNYVTMRASGKLIYEEFFDGNDGWIRIQGKKSKLTAERIKELQVGFYGGFGGLKKDRIGKLIAGRAAAEKDGGYSLSYSVEEKPFKMLIDREYRIIGEERTLGKTKVVVDLGKFRTVKGILLPFIENQAFAGQKMELRISDYFINELNESDWTSIR
jgi:hypothetical protein